MQLNSRALPGGAFLPGIILRFFRPDFIIKAFVDFQ
jgi:hypothetical protein